MKSPLEITETEQYWIHSRNVSDSPRIGGDGYFSTRGVTRPDDAGPEDLPPADTEAVGEVDREALSERKTIGKWQLTGSPERIDELWPELVADAEAGII